MKKNDSFVDYSKRLLQYENIIYINSIIDNIQEQIWNIKKCLNDVSSKLEEKTEKIISRILKLGSIIFALVTFILSSLQLAIGNRYDPWWYVLIIIVVIFACLVISLFVFNLSIFIKNKKK